MKLYRYDRITATKINASIRLCIFDVIHETKSGFWIMCYGEKKWVSNNAKKRYAYPTKQEALHNFKKRTERAILILSSMLDSSRLFLKAAENTEID